MSDDSRHARASLEEGCARRDLQRAREPYAPDFVDHVDAAEFRGRDRVRLHADLTILAKLSRARAVPLAA